MSKCNCLPCPKGWLILLFLAAYPLLSHAQSPGTEKRVTLNKTNTPLRVLFDEISRQTKLYFMAVSSDINQDARVTIKVENESLSAVLHQLLDKQGLDFNIKNNVIRILPKSKPELQQQQQTSANVTGRITDSTGKPIPGATILIKGTKYGTTTDTEGNFTLAAGANAFLIISSVSYMTQEIPVNNRISIGIVMLKPLIGQLDETVVIAYGSTTRRYIIGDVTSIKASDIEKQPVNNPLYALQGRVSGVIVTPTSGLPGAPVSIQIRGRNTLNPNNKSEPLYIVDGLPYGNQLPTGLITTITPTLGALGVSPSPFNFINPNDIESIDVLKDAEATSIYGSRGANGVILITTKKGKIGVSKVDITIQNGISNVSKKLNLLSTPQYIEMRKEALINDGRIGRLNDTISNAGTYPDLLLFNQNQYTDWQKELIGKIAKYTDAQVSISGGTSLISYIISGNYHRETTVFPGNSFDQKASGHFSLTGNSQNQKIHTTVNGSYIVNNSNFPGVDLTAQIFNISPNAPSLFTKEGKINWAYNKYTGRNSWELLGGQPISYLKIPYNLKQSNFISSTEIKYDIFKNLVLKGIIGYSEFRGNSYKGTTAEGLDTNYLRRAGINAFRSEFLNSTTRNFNFNPQISYDNTTSKRSINILLGADLQNTSTERQRIAASGFSNDALIKDISAATTVTGNSASSQYKYTGIFARGSFSLKNTYFLNISGRRDGSSRFGPGRQFGNFGSIGMAYLFTNETLIKQWFPNISFGKFRVTFGTSGNDGNADYAYLDQYASTAGDLPYQGVKGYASLGLFNSSYGWETTKKLEIGIDLGLLNDRIIIQLNAYRNRSNSQLVNLTFPSYLGYGNVLVNFPALIQNKGLESNIDIAVIKNRNLKWNSSLTLTILRNKLLKFPGLETSPYASQFEIGKPYSGVARSFCYAGVDSLTGQFQFKKIDGKISIDPSDPNRLDGGQYLRIMTAPKYYGGIKNSLSYKNISLDIFIQFVKQLAPNPEFQFASTPGGIGNRFESIMDRWKEPGDISSHQKFTTTGSSNGLTASFYRVAQSDKGYVDASFVRVKNLSLSYQINRSMLEHLGLNSARLFIQTSNLYTISKYKGFDPETQSLTTLPPLRTITIGININL